MTNQINTSHGDAPIKVEDLIRRVKNQDAMAESAVADQRDPLSETEEKLLERAFQDFYRANQGSL